MKKIKVKYTQEQLQELGKLASETSVRLMDEVETDIKLRGVLLGRLAMKVADRLVYDKDKYDFNYAPEEALAFYISYDNGEIVSLNNWTVVILNQTYTAIHKALNL